MGRWWSVGLALVLALGCGKSKRSASLDAGSAGGAPGEGGASAAGGELSEAGAGGTGGEGTGGTSGHSAGSETSAGKSGGGKSSGGKSGSAGSAACPTNEAGGAGESGDSGDVWIDDPVMGVAPLCVPDCSSAAYAPAERVGCDWVCPESAPVRTESCEIRCNAHIVCGPGLFCASATQTYASDAENCVYPNEDDDYRCGCIRIPEQCEASGTDRPLCGEDGAAYPSLCEANRARTDLVAYGDDATCTQDDDAYFQCGGIFCLRGSEYCTLGEALDDQGLERFDCVASSCAASGGCECALAEFSDDEDPPSCVEREPGVIILNGPFL